MEFTQLFGDDDAVSPVIGVILMVAITVILAAVIGTFVLGLGDQVSNTSPQASFSFDYTTGASTVPGEACTDYGGATGSEYLEVTHNGGDSVTASQVSLTDGTSAGTNGWESCDSGAAAADDISAGDTATLDGVQGGDTIRVTWESSNGGDTATLGKWTGPSA